MLRQELRVSCVRHCVMFVLAVMLAVPAVFAPRTASAGFFDFLFSDEKPCPRIAANCVRGSFGTESQPAQARTPVANAGRTTSYCVRTCDGRYFPLTMRGGATPAQICQSFCPASPTKVFSGSTIDNAIAASGERYPDSAQCVRLSQGIEIRLYLQRPRSQSALHRSICRSTPRCAPATSWRLPPGWSHIPASRPPRARPRSSHRSRTTLGLTADVRARLGEMKVAPVSAEVAEEGYVPPDDVGTLAQPDFTQPASGTRKQALKDKRADLN